MLNFANAKLRVNKNLKKWRNHSVVRGDRDSPANLMSIYGDLYQIKV